MPLRIDPRVDFARKLKTVQDRDADANSAFIPEPLAALHLQKLCTSNE